LIELRRANEARAGGGVSKDGNMIELLIERFAFLLGFTALTLTVGMLLLVAARDIYAVDSRRKEIRDPVGPSRWEWEWALMSDFAQNARTELVILARNFVFAVVLMVTVVVVLYTAEVMVQILAGAAHAGWIGSWLGERVVSLHETWKANAEIDSLVRYGLATVVVLVTPVLLGKTAFVVRNVIRAKEKPMMNKDPWWA
jgi:hypothetical protein